MSVEYETARHPAEIKAIRRTTLRSILIRLSRKRTMPTAMNTARTTMNRKLKISGNGCSQFPIPTDKAAMMAAAASNQTTALESEVSFRLIEAGNGLRELSGGLLKVTLAISE